MPDLRSARHQRLLQHLLVHHTAEPLTGQLTEVEVRITDLPKQDRHRDPSTPGRQLREVDHHRRLACSDAADQQMRPTSVPVFQAEHDHVAKLIATDDLVHDAVDRSRDVVACVRLGHVLDRPRRSSQAPDDEQCSCQRDGKQRGAESEHHATLHFAVIADGVQVDEQRLATHNHSHGPHDPAHEEQGANPDPQLEGQHARTGHPAARTLQMVLRVHTRRAPATDQRPTPVFTGHRFVHPPSASSTRVQTGSSICVATST